jgi:hypothetical protein
MSKDDLTKLDQKLKSEGKDTTNLDKIIDNFDKLDTDGNGTVSMGELQSGAQTYGIQIPQHHGGGHHHGGGGGVSQAQSDSLISMDFTNTQDPTSASSTSSVSNSILDQILQSFGMSDPSNAPQQSISTNG